MIPETQGKQFQQQQNEIEQAKKTIRMQNAALNEIENEYNRIQLSLLKLEDEIEKKEKEICEQFNENSLANVITILQEEYDTLKEDIEHVKSLKRYEDPSFLDPDSTQSSFNLYESRINDLEEQLKSQKSRRWCNIC